MQALLEPWGAGVTLVAVHRLLIVEASLVSERGLWSMGSEAQAQ